MMTLMQKDIQEEVDRWDSLVENDITLTGAATPCVNGKAGGYPCKNMDLFSVLSHSVMGSSGQGNDIWGWTDPLTGKEYALVGQTTGTAFVDITDPVNPIFKGTLNTATNSSLWRDIKVYKNHAYIVAESTDHGIQVFDLTQLRAEGSGKTFTATARYTDVGSCHNIVINEETGLAICVGAKTCSGGLYMVDITNPVKPTYAGCFSADGYVHDAQCVIYSGPDTKYKGKELCFCFATDTVTIVDVTNRQSPIQISRTGYEGFGYTHQGWLIEDQSFVMFNDELDEKDNTNKNNGITTTYILDVTSLENPVLTGYHLSPVKSIDHNLYILGDYSYMANYCSGLRVADVSGIKSGNTSEVAYFDVRPEDDGVNFNGIWSSYPYFASGNIILNSIERGLFVVKLNFDAPSPTTSTSTAPGPIPTTPPVSTCDHDKCVQGVKLVASCDECVAKVIAKDSYCANTKWDSVCVSTVKYACGITC